MPQLCTTSFVDLQMAYIMESYTYDFGKLYEEDGILIFRSILDLFETALVTIDIDIWDYIMLRATHDIELEREKESVELTSDVRNELDIIQTIINQQDRILT